MKSLHALIKTQPVKSCEFVSCVVFSILKESSFFPLWMEEEEGKKPKRLPST